jgi:hypothetical protein
MADKKNAESKTEMSKEEIAKRRSEVTKFYESNIKHLKIQLEYENLLTEIEKTRVSRIQAQMFLAQTYGDNSEDAATDEGVAEAKKEFNEAAQNIKSGFRPLKTN